MVALSVSTSAMISPFLMTSPTDFNHLAITPSIMVSLILGIRTATALTPLKSMAGTDAGDSDTDAAAAATGSEATGAEVVATGAANKAE